MSEKSCCPTSDMAEGVVPLGGAPLLLPPTPPPPQAASSNAANQATWTCSRMRWLSHLLLSPAIIGFVMRMILVVI
ncbi:MAG: hypothetical protein M3Y55_10565 [Pseudomonadota bacterium]|nr:hypothetical protein [Pseudomonadota bacterium]